MKGEGVGGVAGRGMRAGDGVVGITAGGSIYPQGLKSQPNGPHCQPPMAIQSVGEREHRAVAIYIFFDPKNYPNFTAQMNKSAPVMNVARKRRFSLEKFAFSKTNIHSRIDYPL